MTNRHLILVAIVAVVGICIAAMFMTYDLRGKAEVGDAKADLLLTQQPDKTPPTP